MRAQPTSKAMLPKPVNAASSRGSVPVEVPVEHVSAFALAAAGGSDSRIQHADAATSRFTPAATHEVTCIPSRRRRKKPVSAAPSTAPRVFAA